MGLIEKHAKGNVQWRVISSEGGLESSEEGVEMKQIRSDMASMVEEESLLDSYILSIQNEVKENESNPMMYVTHSDFLSLPCFLRQTLFALKGLPGTTLDVSIKCMHSYIYMVYIKCLCCLFRFLMWMRMRHLQIAVMKYI